MTPPRLAAALISLLAALIPLRAPAEGPRLLASPVFQSAGDGFAGVIPVQKDDLWGLIGADGTFVVPPTYAAIGRSGLGRLPVEKDGLWGVIDATGKTVTPFAFQEIGKVAEWTPMRWKGQWWAVGPTGAPEGQPLPFDVLVGNDGTCMVGKKDGVPIAVNRGTPSASTMLSANDDMRAPSEGFVPFRKGLLEGHLDCAYGVIVGGEAGADAVGGFHQGLAALKQGRLWGFGSVYGTEWEFGGTWAEVGEMAEGLAAVRAEGALWAYVDALGVQRIAPAFDQARPFQDGMAAVQQAGKWGFVATNGTFVIPLRFDEVRQPSQGRVAVRAGGLWSVIAAPPLALLTARLTPLTDALEAVKTALIWRTNTCPSHIIPAGTEILQTPTGPTADTVPQGQVMAVCPLGSSAGFTRISHNGTEIGLVPDAALIPLR